MKCGHVRCMFHRADGLSNNFSILFENAGENPQSVHDPEDNRLCEGLVGEMSGVVVIPWACVLC